MLHHGFLVVDKQPEMTSHDVVAIARRALGTRKVGHAGTLDPMATGVLVLGINNGTRLLQYISDGDKSYQATVVLGASTITDDVQGEVISFADTSNITNAQIEMEFSKFRGTIMQRPSSVSAVKIDGQRAYARVRSGQEVILPQREVTISQLDILAIRKFENGIEIDIQVTCSSGTFIRAVARDVGMGLGVGGHLNSLRRSRVARFSLDMAVTIEQLKNGDFTILDLAEVARVIFPVRQIGLDEKMELSFGRPLESNLNDQIFAGITGANELVALLQNLNGQAKPLIVFTPAN